MTSSPIRAPDLTLNSKRLFQFVLAIIMLMSLVFILISSILIRDSLNQFYNSYVELETTYLEDGIKSSLNNKLSNMRDNASLPLIVNSVMHPEHDHSFLKGFLEDLYLQKNRVDYVLLDINGVVLQSNALSLGAGLRDWPQQKWFSKLVDGELQQYVEMVKTGQVTDLLMAVPVKYNNYSEGVMVGVLPWNLDARFGKLLDDRPIFATIFSNGMAIHKFGKKSLESSSKKRIELPIISGALEIEVYKTEINEVLFNLITTVLIVVAIFSVVFVYVFRHLGIRLFIQPQKMIEQSIVETMAINNKLSIANDELAQFAYRASHDLKAPLVTTRGLADFIREDIDAGEYIEARSNTVKISDHVGRLERLVVDILDLAKADLEMSNKEDIDIRTLIDDIYSRLEKSHIDNDVAIEVEVDESFDLFASRTRISQVLENLISNAIKYYDPNKATHFVKVTATSQDDRFEIRVRDNGLGIPEEFDEKVFTMFQRFHPDVAYGSGLGLYIVKKHTDKMQAEMSYTSSSGGTEFTISLPRT